ncbi:MAG TPA: hypothetical protein VMR52_07350 [Dehalococcoidia bacterium]|nr:hypothetical protein [Dehalococcoidia bacterium]
MTTRTLILGPALPNVSFDNASFLSAPSLSEYQRLLIDPLAASQAIDEVVNGTGAHQTFGGQAIVNGEASSHAFSLPELLAMRRRETERMLERGGLIICFAHPDAAHECIAGDMPWRRYSWLPEDPGFSPRDHLLAGFGRPGSVNIEDQSHPFASFLNELKAKVAFRAQVDEDAPALRESGHIFARNTGGFAIAFDIPYTGGRIVFLPALERAESVRAQVSAALVRCLSDWDEAHSQSPQLLRKEAS